MSARPENFTFYPKIYNVGVLVVIVSGTTEVPAKLLLERSDGDDFFIQGETNFRASKRRLFLQYHIHATTGLPGIFGSSVGKEPSHFIQYRYNSLLPIGGDADFGHVRGL